MHPNQTRRTVYSGRERTEQKTARCKQSKHAPSAQRIDPSDIVEHIAKSESEVEIWGMELAATSLQKKIRSSEIHEEMDQINTRADQKAKYEPEQLLNDHDPVATFKTSPTPFHSIFYMCP